MAEIILTIVINKFVEIAGNLLFQEGDQLYWLKEDMNWLQREMRHIRSYIDDAKAKIVEGDSRVKNFLKDIQELADDVEDLLDELLPNILESHKSKAAIGCLKTTCIPSHSSSVHEFAKGIEKIKRRVVEIDRVRTTYNIMDTSENNDQHDYVPLDRRRLFLHIDETEVIGLDDDFSMLQAKLLDQDIRYGVISIVGMPGLGKTTLAKKLFRHVSDQFECSALTYVSQKPRVGDILLDIAKQVKLTEEEIKDNLEVNLRSFLKIKRYVILLDDIWNVEIWDDLKLIFPESDSKAGSKIIITSRNSNVGRYIGGNSSLHMLQPLNAEKSFELFTNSFTFEDKYWANDPPNMESIGRDIVGRCGGIPLAIVVIAGMLRVRERTEHAWNTVLKTMSQNIQYQCVKILALSYKDLPAALRPCFLYFGLFPEDHEIFAFDLTNMWVAEKFIVKSDSSRRQVEDIAEDFLNDLVSRNLIQVSRRTFQGRILSCRIHDLLHNLCVTLARESNFFLTTDNESSDPSDVARLRRLSFYSGDVDKFFSSYPKPKKLRALLCYSSSLYRKTNLKLLRVLSITISSNSYQIASIPDGIGNLSCLCYFKLWGKNFTGHMPRSILKLKNLLTLDIQFTRVGIDVDVMEMKQLRHLRLSQLPQFPAIVVDELDEMLARSFPFFITSGGVNTGNALLPNLQTLTGMDDLYMRARWLHQLTNLRKLSAKVSNKIVKVFSTPLAILPRLEVLKLYSPMSRDNDQQNQQINLSSYDNCLKLSLRSMDLKIVNFEAFPANLLKLSLSDVELDMYHIQMLKRLPKLVILKLYRCLHDYTVEKLDMSGANSFQQLQALHIIRSRGLWEVTVDELGMPKLNRAIVDTWVILPERLEKLRHR